MKRIVFIVFAALLTFSTIFFLASRKSTVKAQSVAPIPQTILTGLRAGGVNLQFGWYDPYQGNRNEFDDDLPIIKSKGGGHVRLPLSMDTIEQGTTGKINTSRWQELVAFVNRAKSNGLVTIVDIHNTNFANPGGDWNENYMEAIANSSVRARHLSLLTDIAAHMYTDMDRNWVVLQPGNEPINISSVWASYQPQLIKSMRSACPDCVLFAISGYDWQGVGATINFFGNPTATDWYDQRVIIDMHMYSPISLTHCSYPGQTNNCPGKSWPGTYADYTPVTGVIHSGTWNKAFLESELSALWSWGQQYNLTFHFSEIGTTGDLADSVRGPYVNDVTSILQAHGAGWSCYEWDKNFGMYPNHPQTISACFKGNSTPVPTSTPGGTNPTPTRTPTPRPTTGAGTPTPTTPPIQSGPLTLMQPLQLSASSVQIGGSVSGSAIYKNTSSQSITVNQWAIAGRPPGGTNADGPYLDFPYGGPVTIAPGQEYTMQATRTFTSSDPTGIWYVFTTYEVGGTWYDAPSSLNLSLGVGVTITPTPGPTGGTTPLPTAPPGGSIIPNAPAWFSQATENIKGFLEQLYLTVVVWQRESNFCHLLQGIVDNSQLSGCASLTP